MLSSMNNAPLLGLVGSLALLGGFSTAHAQDVFDALTSSGGASDSSKDIPLGIEAVTGLRSNYFYRGFDLADSTLDFQLETEVALSNHWFVNVGGWYASEGDGDFRDTSAFVEVRKEWKDFTFSLIAAYHDYDGSDVFESGLDFGVESSWYISEAFDLKVGLYRDFEAEAWYAKVEGGYSRKVTDDSYLTLSTGLSWVDDYYGRDGLNDYFGRLAFTYNVNSGISLTPFVGYSVPFEGSDPLAEDSFEAGLWFEVSF